MIQNYLSRKYAKGLFDFIQEKNYEPLDIYDQLLFISKIIDWQILSVIKHPGISFLEKKNLLENLFGENVYKELKEFMFILICKKRIQLFNEIVEIFKNILEEFSGILKVEVSSSYELSKEQKKILENKISSFKSKKIIADYEINYDLIAGLVIKIGDQIYDNSLKTQLEKLQQRFWK